MTREFYSLKEIFFTKLRTLNKKLSHTLYLLLFLVLIQGSLLAQVLNVTQASVLQGFEGKVPNLTGASAVFVQGNYAYVVGTGNMLQIFDITLPGLPVPKGVLYHGTGGASILRAQNIVVRGNYAYITSYGEDAFEIVDVSDPSKPVHKAALYDGKGSAPYLKGAWDVQLVGDYAYVVSASSFALEIIDISNPSNPRHTASLLDGAGDTSPHLASPVTIEIKDNLAYIGNLGGTTISSKLQVVDISNPTVPTPVGDITLGNNQFPYTHPIGIAIAGNYAYVTDWWNGALETIDISNPALPVHSSMLVNADPNVLTPGVRNPPYLYGAWAIQIAGNYAYIGLNTNIRDPLDVIKNDLVGGLEVVDISNPGVPVHAGAGVFSPSTRSCREIQVVGDKVYMPGRINGTLSIVSITQPTAPKILSTATRGPGGAIISTPSTVLVDGNYAYIGNRAENFTNGPGALEIVNVSDPTRPVHEGSIDENSGGTLSGTAALSKRGNFVYTVSDRFHAVQVIDVTIPSSPVGKGTLRRNSFEPSPIPILGAKAIATDPATFWAFVASGRWKDLNNGGIIKEGSNAIAMISIENADAPTFNTALLDGGGSAPYLKDPSSIASLFPLENFLYVASKGSNALEVVQLFTPTNIMEHGGSLLDGGGAAPYLNQPVSVVVQGNYAYVASAGSKALEIVNITNRANPVHAGAFLDGQQGVSLQGINNVRVSGNYAYVTTNTFVSGSLATIPSSLVVIDISNPAAPVHVDTFFDREGGAILDGPTSLFISGPYAYMTNSGLSMNLNIAYLFGPKITNIQPTSAPVGSSVTVTGENFNTFLTATVNGTSAAVTNVTATTLTFTVPPGATNGKIGLTLNGQTISSANNFIVTPTAAAATTVQQTSFTAKWSDVGAAGYFFDLSTDDFSTFVTGFNNQSVGNVTSLAISGLNSGTSYQYRVRSSDGTISSGNSNTITFTTIPATPTATAATELTQSGFRANWNSIAGATSYVIDVAYDEAFSSFIVGYNNLSVLSTSTSQLVSGLNSYTQCYYRVRALSAGGSSPSSNRITALTLDIIQPIIAPAGTPNATTVTSGNTPILNALITDNVGINLAEIFYRGISETSFKKATMQGPGGVGGNYSITIQSNWYDQMGLEYYFKAYDKAGNETVSQTNFIQLITPSITVPTLPSGSTQNDYRIIAFPFQLTTDNKVSTVYSGIPWNDNTKAGLWWWNTSAQNGKGAYDQYGTANSFETIDQGKGYWAITSTSFAPQLSNVAAPKFNRSNLYSMTLKPNWNLIGNPYPLSISWDEVIAFNLTNGINTFSSLSVYDGTGYKVATGDLFLKPFEGGFVKNLSSSDITIQIPFIGQLTGGRIETIASDIAQNSWSVFMHIDQNNLSNQLGGFGMHPSAIDGEDRFDLFNPPSFLNAPSVSFTNQKLSSLVFSKEMVKTEDGHIWQFTPSGTIGQTAQLHWSPDIITSGSRQLFLLDEEHLNVIDMLSVHEYTFTLTQSSKFRIFYGSNIQAKITTQQVAVGAPYPNPLIDGTTPKINVSLPDLVDHYQLSLQLYNARGELVGTVIRNFRPGIHPLEFLSSAESLPSGFYVYKIAITSSQSSSVYTGKIVKP